MRTTTVLLVALVLAFVGVAQAQNSIVLLEEDFEGLLLGPNVEEGLAGEAVWTETPPDGWVVDDSDVPGAGDSSTDGVTEWAGWGFANKDWWIQAAEDQRRSEFTLGEGTVAIADPDEWDDSGHPAWAEAGFYDAWMATRPIDLSAARPGTVQLKFDSSWRPEAFDDGDGTNHQTAQITVSFDGGEPVEILLWDSDSKSPHFKNDESTNETIVVDIDNPAGAISMVLNFGLLHAGNDWWWAVDNLVVTGERSAKLAYNPDPADKATEVPVKTVMSWTPGAYAGAVSPHHRVSLSDDAGAVGSGAAIVSTQDANSYDATGQLGFDTTYCWRIDEANGVGWDEGNLWNFTTESFVYTMENVVATSNGVTQSGAEPENTVNGSGLNADSQHSTKTSDMWLAIAPAGETLHIQFEFDHVYKLYQMLVWNYNAEFDLILGFGLKDVTVQYSQDGTDWTALGDVELARSTAKATYTANTTVDFGGVAAKFVRLTVNSGWGVMGQFGLSEVRFMYIPAHARDPQPADGATDVEVGAALSWRIGREAVSHEVSLGMSPDDVQPVATVGHAGYVPGNLEFATTYYWKVDEVNEADAVTVWPGALWSFTVQEYATVEGFETYNDDVEAETTIYSTWIDGWVNGNGSTVGYFDAPFAERQIVHSGKQSMPLAYDNSASPFYSEAERIFDGPQDWTIGGADSVMLYFQGVADNSPQTLYVTLEDSAGGSATVSATDPDAILVAEWQPWRIMLSEFGGVNPAAIEKMIIGVGNRANPTSDGTGVVYIDDIGFGRPAAQ